MASRLLHDPSRWREFNALANGQDAIGCPNNRVNILEINVPKSPSLFEGPYAFSEDIERLSRRTRSDIRIVFAPLDYPNPQSADLLSMLVELFDVPTAFLSERIQGVTNASNFEGSRDGDFICWMHFLCKAIVERPDAPTWHRAGFLLSRSADDGVNVICFGARRALIERFQHLSFHAWSDIYNDPLAVLPVILWDVQLILDEQAWALNTFVGRYEHQAISTTRTKAKFPEDFFQDLHWVAKNVVHLKESAEAALNTCQQFLAVSQLPCAAMAGQHASPTTTTLTYLSTLLHSACLRTSSLQGRIQNTIGLAFNLVAQTDSRCLMAESSSMHTMALATLIFLPISTVASIFGSQFFQFRAPDADRAPDPNATDFILSREFWLFWAITVPLTVVVLATWLVSHPHSVGRWFRKIGCGKRRTQPKADIEGPHYGDAAGSLLLQPLSSHYSGVGLVGSSTGSSTLVPGKGTGISVSVQHS